MITFIKLIVVSVDGSQPHPPIIISGYYINFTDIPVSIETAEHPLVPLPQSRKAHDKIQTKQIMVFNSLY